MTSLVIYLYSDNHHHTHTHHLPHDDGGNLDLGKALEREGIKLRGTQRLAHRKLETYYTDNTNYKYSYEVGVYVEVDQTLVNNEGGQAGMSQYIEELFAGMNIIYEKEVDTHLSVTGIAIVTRYDDATSTSAALNVMQSQLTGGNWPNTSPPSDLAHAILGRGLGGGIAYVGVLCNTGYGTGVSAGISGSYNINTPKAMVWDIVVVAHGKCPPRAIFVSPRV